MSSSVPGWTDCLEYAAFTDVGMRRASNQDYYAVSLAEDQHQWQRRGHLFLVADGMGAHAAGELASKMAAENVVERYRRLIDLPPPTALKQSLQEANEEIYHFGERHVDCRGMGTTCSALLLLPQGAVVSHVGDSRVYRLRGHRLEQLTFDHSLAWELLAASRFSEELISTAVPKNVITRSLGPNGSVEVDMEGPFPLRLGDTFLVCSDGLTGFVDDEELGQLLVCLPPDDAVRTMTALANLRGGADNITAIVARVAGPPMVDGSETGFPPRPRRGRWGSSRAATALAVAAAVLLLVSAASLVVWQPAVAVGTLIGSLLAAAGAFMARRPAAPPPTDQPLPWGPLGAGPHRAFDCPPDRQLVATMAEIIENFPDGTDEEGRCMVPEGYSAEQWNRADASRPPEDVCTAVADYAAVLRDLAGQLRP